MWIIQSYCAFAARIDAPMPVNDGNGDGADFRGDRVLTVDTATQSNGTHVDSSWLSLTRISTRSEQRWKRSGSMAHMRRNLTVPGVAPTSVCTIMVLVVVQPTLEGGRPRISLLSCSVGQALSNRPRILLRGWGSRRISSGQLLMCVWTSKAERVRAFRLCPLATPRWS